MHQPATPDSRARHNASSESEGSPATLTLPAGHAVIDILLLQNALRVGVLISQALRMLGQGPGGQVAALVLLDHQQDAGVV